MEIFFRTSAGCSNLVLCSIYCIVCLFEFLSSVTGLCCKIDYRPNLEIGVKIMTFELCFMRCGNFWEGAGMRFWNGKGM